MSLSMDRGARILAECVHEEIRLREFRPVQPMPEFSYPHLTCRLIEAFLSVGIRAEASRAAVRNYCDAYGLRWIPPAGSDEPRETCSQLFRRIEKNGADWFAEKILKNRSRTSTTNGILKTTVIGQAAALFADAGLETMLDIPAFLEDRSAMDRMEASVLALKGQSSGVSWRYLTMLMGRRDVVKPDRMVRRFIGRIMGKEEGGSFSDDFIQGFFARAVEVLKMDYGITTDPRTLDEVVWTLERRPGDRTGQSHFREGEPDEGRMF